MPHTQKRKEMNGDCPQGSPQDLDFPDKNFKSDTVNMLKEVKEAVYKEQKEVMRRISHH